MAKNYIADKETLDAVKETTDSIKTTTDTVKETTDSIKTTTDTVKETTDSIKTTTDSVKTTTDSIKTEVENVQEAATGIKEDTESIKTLLSEGGGSEAADVASILGIVKQINEKIDSTLMESYSFTFEEDTTGNVTSVHVKVYDISNGSTQEGDIASGETFYATVANGHEYTVEAYANKKYYGYLKKDYTAVGGGVKSDKMTCSVATFADAPFEAIDQAIEDNVCSTLWNVGDKRTMSIGGVDYEYAIMDFAKDTYTAGGTAPMTLGLVNCLNTTYKMNSSNTNVGGWGSSAGRTTLQGTIFNSLPEEVRSRIKKVKKKASAGNQSTSISTYDDTLFLFSESEIFGTKTYSTGNEGEQYEYFKTSANRIKKLGDDGSANGWWERSPCASGATYFCFVNSGGNADSNLASATIGFSFGFCF